jgi:hypothetical protein
MRFYLPHLNQEGVGYMPKMGISVDETTYKLLKKHGGARHIGALIGRMVREFDKEEAFGLQAIRQRLDRIADCLIDLAAIKEWYREK